MGQPPTRVDTDVAPVTAVSPARVRLPAAGGGDLVPGAFPVIHAGSGVASAAVLSLSTPVRVGLDAARAIGGHTNSAGGDSRYNPRCGLHRYQRAVPSTRWS